MSTKSPRQIGSAGTVARSCVGVALLAVAVVAAPTVTDLLVGVVGLPLVVIAGLALRGQGAPPLRLHGSGGYVLNVAVAVVAVSLVPVGAAVFYGGSMVLAALRGMGACEVFVVSNMVWRRDDQLGCPVFAPIDAVEARRGLHPGT